MDADKTKEQLIGELAGMRQRITELQASEARCKQLEDILQERTHKLNERIKELSCLYEIANIVEKQGISLEEILQGVVDLIPPSWQYPEITCARIVLEGQEFKTKNSAECSPYWKQTGDIIVSGSKIGIFEVCYLEERQESNEGPFLVEERNLLNVITERLGRIIERKQAQEDLTNERERLSVTLRSIGDGVIATDEKGKVVLMNKVAETLTGWTEESAIGKPLNEVFHIINEDTRKRCENPVEKVLKTGGTANLANNTVLIARNGIERIIDDSGAPIHHESDKVTGVVLVFRDITEKRKIEEELVKIQKIESIGVLAGGIAHDFNNILTGILGNISLTRLYKDPEEISEKLMEAEKASLRARDLTQQLLTFSKGGAPVMMTSSIAEILEDSTVFALSGSNVRCKFAISDDLWLVDIDKGQISQVINNLIVNADQAMPNGGVIVVRAENVTLGSEDVVPLEDGKYVKISIADQGVGIPNEYLNKIFDPYFSTKQNGSGLGLATSYFIVKNHNGYITAESQVGMGTTFYIYIPARRENISMEKEKEKEKAADELIVDGGRILVVDDEESIRKLASEILIHIGYAVTVAEDGAEAIKLYKAARESGHSFDIVIMDLTMPGGMGGKEAVQKLIEIDPEVKALVSSGYSNDSIMANFRKYGFSGVLTKPYGIKDMKATLYKTIAKTS